MTQSNETIRGMGAAVGQAFQTAIDEHEKSELQLIDQCEQAEESLSQAYYLVTGRSPEWSNLFGHDEALEDIKDACELMRAEVRQARANEVAPALPKREIIEAAAKRIWNIANHKDPVEEGTDLERIVRVLDALLSSPGRG